MRLIDSLKTKNVISEKEIHLIYLGLNSGLYSLKDVEFLSGLNLEVKDFRKVDYLNKEYKK